MIHRSVIALFKKPKSEVLIECPAKQIKITVVPREAVERLVRKLTTSQEN